MRRPRRHLRTRLMAAILLVALGVLVVATFGAVAIARETAADAALKDLRKDATTTAAELGTLAARYRRAVANGSLATSTCALIESTLRISGGSVVTVTPQGGVEEGLGRLLSAACTDGGKLLELPPGVTVGMLDTDRLLAGKRQSRVTRGLAFVAEPLAVTTAQKPVLILVREVESRPLGRAGGFLIATGAGALLVAAVVAALLSRRLTRPIAAMQTTAGRIAAGDLTARVKLRSVPNDELGSLARSIDTMADELEAARGHERAFLLSISHDLRTPLTSIKGYAEAMVDGTVELPADRARAAAVIVSETARLERLVADLLDLARLDAHQFSLTRRSVDARKVVDATVEGFAPLARDWGVHLRLTSGSPVPTETDPERLGQIVANLVENALKYARAAVVVDVSRFDGHVELRVDDDGPGIAADERDRVFERLYTARGGPGRVVGTGIGLAIVHELAGAMGGNASCRALESGGTSFLVRLPA